MTHADKVKEFYREQGRTEEQERIIQILIEAQGKNWWLGDLIALIKGDNK
jgi:hypothetical protein